MLAPLSLMQGHAQIQREGREEVLLQTSWLEHLPVRTGLGV